MKTNKLIIIEKYDYDDYTPIAYLYLDNSFNLQNAKKEFQDLMDGFTFQEPEFKQSKMSMEERNEKYKKDMAIKQSKARLAWDNLISAGYLPIREDYQKYSYDSGRLDERDVLEAFSEFLKDKYKAIEAENIESCSQI